MNWLGEIYQKLWFFSEFWLTPIDRRPYTFIFRDWLYSHPSCFVVILIIWFGGLFTWNLFHPVPASIVGFLSAGLLSHLCWGSKWIEQEQEWPTYLGENDDK